MTNSFNQFYDMDKVITLFDSFVRFYLPIINIDPNVINSCFTNLISDINEKNAIILL
jgi:hypothetical protein